MTTITIEEAQAKLRDLIHALPAGEEVVITDGDRPVARLLPAAAGTGVVRRPGTMKGTILYIAPDFNAPLCGFQGDER